MKNMLLLSFAAISALASEPMMVQKITVEADTTLADVSSSISTTTLSKATKMSGDSATLLNDLPGVSLYSNGSTASLPVIHGMADDRVKIDIDGMTITSACPNHMNPALSYIDSSKIAVIGAIAGITPVSEGGDSIGGTIIVRSKDPLFAQKSGEVIISGDLSGFYHSNNAARGAAVTAAAANDKISVSYAGFAEKSGDYTDGNGKLVKDSLYQQQNHAATLAYKINDDNIVSLKLTKTYVDFVGFPNEYMDMLDNKSTNFNLRYKGRIGTLLLDANAYNQKTDHYMNKIWGERQAFNPASPYGMPMYTQAKESGFNLKVTLPISKEHTLKFGTEYNKYTLNDWWPPISTTVGGMGNETFININNGHRDRIGLFAETVSQWSDKLSSVIGLRSDIVKMNTGDVKGYNPTVNDGTDATNFNLLDQNKRDVNYDFTAMSKYEYSNTSDIELGFARKTRSPNIYERYAWAGGYGSTPLTSGPIAMDMAMVNWFGDGNGYVGNLNLKPEVANTISTTLSFHDSTDKVWGLKLTPYYSKVANYIDVNVLGTATAGGYTGIRLLQFANHDAHFFGADLSGHVTLWDNAENGVGTLTSVMGYTRGFRDDGGSLYHIMPFHAKISLDRVSGAWNNGIDIQAVAKKDSVDSLRKEPMTPGYALVDLRTGYQISKDVKFDVAVTNFFNQAYAMPLGGIDVVDYAKTTYTPLQGMGRSFNTALNIRF
ncbi:MAG: TonB-dependent receptor [Sulfuricurvum sp.]|nr:TonB-dependent receptor [Sulfuricurvum sp.]